MNTIKHHFRTLFVGYICICLLGCVTPRLIEYAEDSGEVETRQWNLEEVNFGAIRDNRFIRMCMTFSSSSETTRREVAVDLEKITELLNSHGSTINRFEEVINMETSLCKLDLETGETPVSIVSVHSDAADIASALQQLGHEVPAEPEIVLLQHATGNHLVFRAPLEMFEGLDDHALGSYIETDKKTNAGVLLLLPLTLAADAIVISIMLVTVIFCAIPVLFPLCIPFAVFSKGAGAAMKQDSSGATPSESDALFEDY